jgi:hypothetical protein
MHDVHNAMPQAYGNPRGFPGWDAESGRQLQAAEGRPDHPVTVYRALPAGQREINTGDWVTTSGAYARQHGESNLRHTPWHVVRADVPARHLFNEGYMSEWGYQGPHIANPAVHYVGHDHDRREASLEAEASESMIDLYHHTYPESAEAIRQEKRFLSGDEENRVYFTNSPGSASAKDYGDEDGHVGIVHVRMPGHLVHEWPGGVNSAGEAYYDADADDIRPEHILDDDPASLGHREAAEASDYRLMHGAPGPRAGHLPLHHYTGDDPESRVRVYRSAPAGIESINTGDWVSLNPAYAHRHGYGEARDGGNWPVYTAEVPQRHVHWDENDPDEHGYNGPAIHHPDVHDEETGELHDWDDYHEAHPHGQEAWLGGSVHLPAAEHEFVHDEFEWEPDRADTVLSAAREQGALHHARWRDDIYPAREDAEGHAAQHLGAVPEGHRLTAFTVHRNDAGAIDDIGLHHYEPSDDPYVRRPYAFADLSEHNYSHPAIEEAGRGHQAAYEPPSREYSSGRMLVSDIRRPGEGLLSERPYTQRQMAADIRRNGVEQPLAIEHTTAYGGNPTVINGLHRLDGAQRAGIADVPVVVKHLPGRLPPMLSREPATEQEFNDAYDTERSGRWAGEPGLTAEAEVLEPSKRIRRRAVRQRDGDERSFGEYTMRYRTTDEGERRPRHVIEVFHPDSDQPVGKLSWRGSTRKVEGIDVSGPHQRKGVATAMWGWSQEMSPKARHSDDQTDQGKAWVKSLSAHGAPSSMPATAAAAPGEPVFYHGTNTALAPGTRLTPDDAISFSPGGAASNAVTQGRAPHVFLTTDYKHADMYARVRAQTHGGEPHVYEVRPTGAYDPNPADERFREGLPPMSFRSVHPVTVGGEITEPPKRRKRARAVAAPVASKELAMTRPGAADISRIGSWLPENIGEVQEMLDDFPLLFVALADGLTSLAARLDDNPVDERIPGALATMAAACQSAAEDARDTAVRAHETAGAWHG